MESELASLNPRFFVDDNNSVVDYHHEFLDRGGRPFAATFFYRNENDYDNEGDGRCWGSVRRGALWRGLYRCSVVTMALYLLWDRLSGVLLPLSLPYDDDAVDIPRRRPWFSKDYQDDTNNHSTNPNFRRWKALRFDERPAALTKASIQQQPKANQQPKQHYQPKALPKLAWLLSSDLRGDRGSSYVTGLVRVATDRTVGTDDPSEELDAFGRTVVYENSRKKKDPLYGLGHGHANGPFRMTDKCELPEHFVLTKAHCDFGLLEDSSASASASASAIPQKDSTMFWTECATTAVGRYDPSAVAKVVHLYQHPYDHVIARFRHERDLHIEEMKKTRKKSKKEEMKKNLFEDNEDGFHEWCRSSLSSSSSSSSSDKDKNGSNPLKKDGVDDVCLDELRRYVHWHGNVRRFVETSASSSKTNTPTMTVHLEDLAVQSKEKEEEVNDQPQSQSSSPSSLDLLETLLEFLEEPMRVPVRNLPSLESEPPRERQWVESYFTSLTNGSIEKVVSVLRDESGDPTTWEQMKRYFPKAEQETITTMSTMTTVTTTRTTAPSVSTSLPFSEATSPQQTPTTFSTTDTLVDTTPSNKLFDYDDDSDQPVPRLSWLLGIPGSGAPLVMEAVQASSGTSVATNYGNRPIYTRMPNGPFYYEDHLPLPALDGPRVLTYTHCGWAVPTDASNDNDVDDDDVREETFLQQCVVSDKEGVSLQYDPSTVVSAVHLYRHPLENVVAAFLASLGSQSDNKKGSKQAFLEWCRRKNDDVQVDDVPCYSWFIEYAQWHDLVRRTLVDVLGLRYEPRLNEADDYDNDEGDVMVLHYEEFVLSFSTSKDKGETKASTETEEESTASLALLEHLHLLGQENKKMMHTHNIHTVSNPSMGVEEYFTAGDVSKVGALLEESSSPETWKELQRYFDGTVSTKTKTTTPNTQEEIENDPNYDDDDAAIAAAAAAAVASKNNNKNDQSDKSDLSKKDMNTSASSSDNVDDYAALPRVAWLMSFPNSGTTYTEKLVESLTRLTVATNYGHEHVNTFGVTERVTESSPVFPGVAGLEGPFRLSDLPLPSSPQLVMTKTHCGGYCFSDCPPNWYLLDLDGFRRECAAGARYHPDFVNEDGDGVDGRKWVRYNATDLVHAAVHLIRNPFENVIARFHHEYRVADLAGNLVTTNTTTTKTASSTTFPYPNTPEGFRRWCADANERYPPSTAFGSERAAGPEGLQTTHPLFVRKARDVPCYGEFLKYVRWHDRATATIQAMGIPSVTIRYEAYASNDLDDHEPPPVDAVLDLLGQTRSSQGTDIEFTYHPYLPREQYYTDNEYTLTAQYLRYIAEPDTTRKFLEAHYLQDV